MNVSLYLACGKTVPGYSVNVTRQENFVDATANQRIIKEILTLQLEIKR